MNTQVEKFVIRRPRISNKRREVKSTLDVVSKLEDYAKRYNVNFTKLKTYIKFEYPASNYNSLSTFVIMLEHRIATNDEGVKQLLRQY